VMEEGLHIFISYAPEDEPMRRELEKQLTALKRQGLIDVWHDHKISAGVERAHELDSHLDTDQIILLLVSPDFISSDYCYGVEVKRAMKRHQAGDARVIPIILRPILWRDAPFGKLQALPTNAEPVTSSSWHTRDDAFFDIAKGIQEVVEGLVKKGKAQIPSSEQGGPQLLSRLRSRDHSSVPRGRFPRLVTISFVILLIVIGGALEVGSVFLKGPSRPGHTPVIGTTITLGSTAGQITTATSTTFPSSTPQDTHPYPSYLPGHGQSAAYYDSISSGAMWEQDANSDRTGFCEFSNGAYHATMNKPENNYRTCAWTLNGYFRNFAYAMQVTILQGDCAGVFFRADDTIGIQYDAVLCQGEGLKLYKIGPPPDVQLRLLTEIPMKINLKKSYQMIVVAQDSTLTVFLNGNQVAQTQDSSNLQGYGGVIAIDENNSTDAIFSNATLWTL
jgi:hypothetical protein